MNAIPIEADGKTYRLIYTTNALCHLEEKTGLGVSELFGAVGGATFKIGMARLLMWAGLIEHHPDMTPADAGRIIDAIGINGAAQLIGRAIGQALGEAEKA